MGQGITITYNGLTLGDNSNYYIAFLDPGELPLKTASQEAAGRDGGFVFRQDYGMRRLQLTANIFSPTEEQFFTDIRALRAAFVKTNTPQEMTITYWDGTVRKIGVYPEATPNPTHSPGDVDKSTAIVGLIAPFPFFYSDTSLTASLALAESLGFDYPADYPVSYESGSSPNTYTFTNDGDVPALVAVTFHGPVESPSISNSSSGLFAQIDTTLTRGISVDAYYSTKYGRVIQDQNGTSYEQHYNGTTQFFFAPLGANTLTFSAATYDSRAACDITVTKYYLS